MCISILAQSLPKQCSVSSEEIINLSSHETYISSDEIKSSCLRSSKTWKLTAQIGQRLNVSFINLSEGNGNNAGIYGSIENSNGNVQVLFGPGPREKHLLLSSDYAVVTLQQQAFGDAHFLIHVKGKIVIVACAFLST